MNDYERIARIIRLLDERPEPAPSLEALAAEAGLSPFHFHRLFEHWAGITPKNLLRCLTLEEARNRLRRGASVLDATLDSGLSSPGRLHDLCLRLENATPGEIKSGGAGWTLHAGVAMSPFGPCLLATGPRGLCHLQFLEDEHAGWDELTRRWPAAQITPDPAQAADLARSIFSGPPAKPLRACVAGTPFQIRVWQQLLLLPPGHFTSYARLAADAGFPKAIRATGTAVGANPLAYLIPCHRVLRQTGALGGYRWGTDRKRLILAWECLRHPEI